MKIMRCFELAFLSLIIFTIPLPGYSQTCSIGTPELKLHSNNDGKPGKKTVPVGDSVYSETARATGGMVIAGKPSEIGDNMTISLAHDWHGGSAFTKIPLVSERFQLGNDPWKTNFALGNASELVLVASVMEHDGMWVTLKRPDQSMIEKSVQDVTVISTAAGCLVTIPHPQSGDWSVVVEGNGEVKLTIFAKKPTGLPGVTQPR